MNFEYRAAKHNAVCRCCDKDINKGEMMVTGYSSRNKGQNIHFHPNCVKEMYELCNFPRYLGIHPGAFAQCSNEYKEYRLNELFGGV